MDVAALYRDGRRRQLELAGGISQADAATPVPTCPGWTVKDVYAHQAGVPADILGGRVEGVATDEWTARQVRERAQWSFADVVEELRRCGEQLDPVLEQMGDAIDKRLVLDQWTHEQDVRGALGRPGSRDVAVVGQGLDVILSSHARRWPVRHLPPALVVGSSKEWHLGEGEPVATLEAEDFELLRLVIGRRSRSQALAAWRGDAAAVVDHLVAFSFTERDIVE